MGYCHGEQLLVHVDDIVHIVVVRLYARDADVAGQLLEACKCLLALQIDVKLPTRDTYQTDLPLSPSSAAQEAIAARHSPRSFA